MSHPRPFETEVTLAQVMLPEDANPRGNVHGGTLMKLADSAGGVCAARHARRPLVTDEHGRPTPVPALEVTTDEQRRRWEEAELRRAVRLARPASATPRGRT